MEVNDISIWLAFPAGLLSFFAPCVLPLVPGYIGYLSGSSLGEDSAVGRRKAVLHAVFFVLGFSSVFVALGASVGLVGSLVYDSLPFIRQIGGVILVLLGLHLLGVFRVAGLYRTIQFPIDLQRRVGFLASYLVGIFFAAGWTPCIGPILAGILVLASSSQTVAQGSLLLAIYSAGLGIPFLAAALALGAAAQQLKRVNRYLGVVSAGSGVLLIAMGVLIFTDSLARLSRYFNFWTPPL